MRSKIESSEFAEGVKIVDYPLDFCPVEGLREFEINIDCCAFQERTQNAFLGGIHIEQRVVSVKSPFSYKVSHDFPFLKMQFEVDGFSNFESSIRSVMGVKICPNHHQLFFIPEVKGELNYTTNRNTLEIKLMPSYLQKVFGPDLQPLGQFGRAILEGSPSLLSSVMLPITPNMHYLIHSIRQCSYSGMMKKVFLECKVNELLMMQLDQVLQAEEKIGVPRITDLDKLHYVKELIEKNVEHPKTILQLSELSGLNDFKLKRDFKQVFGTTVFGYLTDYRLNKAKMLLLEGGTIGEVAYKMGYRQPQHFSAAFKRYFGCRPSDIM